MHKKKKISPCIFLCSCVLSNIVSGKYYLVSNIFSQLTSTKMSSIKTGMLLPRTSITCVLGSIPSGISPRSLLIHSTVSFPFFQIQMQVWNIHKFAKYQINFLSLELENSFILTDQMGIKADMRKDPDVQTLSDKFFQDWGNLLSILPRFLSLSKSWVNFELTFKLFPWVGSG